MSELAVDSVELHYEVSGDGPPLVLLTGLGFGIWSWFRQLPALARSFTTIAIDNRGVGGSRAPDGPFTIADMADDTAAVIRYVGRDLGLGPAHVLGLSMGGFIAQELVLRHPQLVRGLVLGCTNAGLGHMVSASADTVATLIAEADAGWSDEVLQRGAHLRFSDACVAERPPLMAELAERRRGKLPPRELWNRQLAAAMGFSAGDRLGEVCAPTLVMYGGDDPIVPPENGELLARLIPGAQSAVFPTGRHLFFLEYADEFNRRVREFLTGLP